MQELFLYIIKDDNGNDSLMSYIVAKEGKDNKPDTKETIITPMITGSLEDAEKLKETANYISQKTNKPWRLVKYVKNEEVQKFDN